MTYEPIFGKAPAVIMEDFRPEWHEFMHYLYLPVRIPASDPSLAERQFPPAKAQWHIPPTLEFLGIAVTKALEDARAYAPHLADPYVYVSARRGMASPDNPLNRPGWHTDDFGGADLNYIWSNRWPTRLLLLDLNAAPKGYDISSDDEQSMKDMGYFARNAADARITSHSRIEDSPKHAVVRLDPYVIHNTPEVPAPGGMRSFFKISVSDHRYDLLGNTHNHGILYDWRMITRDEVRNHQGSNKDYSS